ncbi:MAG: hypothetical protein QM778_29670 [Myxococcales bacterium]
MSELPGVCAFFRSRARERAWPLGLGLAVACGGARYRPPAPDVPHADVRVDVVFHRDFESELRQRVRIDGGEIQSPQGVAAVPRWSRSLRVEPGEHELAFWLRFEHADLATEYIRPDLPGCPPGTATAYVMNDCINQGARAQPTSVWNWIPDAECERKLAFVARANDQLRVTLHFYGPPSSERPACEVVCERRGSTEPCLGATR